MPQPNVLLGIVEPGVPHVCVLVFGTAVDVTVDLEPVGPRSDVEFPIPDPTPSELQDRITTLSGENAALRGQVGAALVIGIGGVLLGVVGIAVGLLAGRRARRGS